MLKKMWLKKFSILILSSSAIVDKQEKNILKLIQHQAVTEMRLNPKTPANWPGSSAWAFILSFNSALRPHTQQNWVSISQHISVQQTAINYRLVRRT